MALTAMDLVAAAKKNIKEVDVASAKSDFSKYLVLDVRAPGEFVAGSLPGAINISRGVLEFKIASHPDFENKQDTDILVYCQTGGRSALATEVLNKMGYSKAVSLEGGYQAWQKSDSADE
ncbi:MAG: rhodanese-like domain-containing protein [Gammaproteobacteria bacterium]|jgi:rhodanese-related sulfurtransferase|uniref:rhodanese-like domain-containing protein n=1 Tax=Methylotuvimicrobium sp. TaxID=2822413 RepID=UPI001D38BB19|nr:rhodanese-like domain-containing protein [Gammaproteobacteria bacterium]